MPFFSNIKKALNFGSSTDNKKRKLISNIKTDINPEDVWEILCDIGDGAFGKVHKARHREDQDRCVDTITMMNKSKLICEREKSQEIVWIATVRCCSEKDSDMTWPTLQVCRGQSLQNRTRDGLGRLLSWNRHSVRHPTRKCHRAIRGILLPRAVMGKSVMFLPAGRQVN